MENVSGGVRYSYVKAETPLGVFLLNFLLISQTREQKAVCFSVMLSLWYGREMNGKSVPFD